MRILFHAPFIWLTLEPRPSQVATPNLATSNIVKSEINKFGTLIEVVNTLSLPIPFIWFLRSRRKKKVLVVENIRLWRSDLQFRLPLISRYVHFSCWPISARAIPSDQHPGPPCSVPFSTPPRYGKAASCPRKQLLKRRPRKRLRKVKQALKQLHSRCLPLQYPTRPL